MTANLSEGKDGEPSAFEASERWVAGLDDLDHVDMPRLDEGTERPGADAADGRRHGRGRRGGGGRDSVRSGMSWSMRSSGSSVGRIGSGGVKDESRKKAVVVVGDEETARGGRGRRGGDRHHDSVRSGGSWSMRSSGSSVGGAGGVDGGNGGGGKSGKKAEETAGGGLRRHHDGASRRVSFENTGTSISWYGDMTAGLDDSLRENLGIGIARPPPSTNDFADSCIDFGDGPDGDDDDGSLSGTRRMRVSQTKSGGMAFLRSSNEASFDYPPPDGYGGARSWIGFLRRYARKFALVCAVVLVVTAAALVVVAASSRRSAEENESGSTANGSFRKFVGDEADPSFAAGGDGGSVDNWSTPVVENNGGGSLLSASETMTEGERLRLAERIHRACSSKRVEECEELCRGEECCFEDGSGEGGEFASLARGGRTKEQSRKGCVDDPQWHCLTYAGCAPLFDE